MIIYDLARKAKRYIKEYKKARDCKFLSPVRRIERFAPVPGRRLCAMTFDDGPSDLALNPPVSEDGLTLHLLKTLESFGAKGTFDVIGTTEGNYPDSPGKEGSFSWGGVRYDHYPDINEDKRGGAKNRPDLIKRILDGGHEITNHGYAHILFGHPKLVYGARASFKNIHEVVDDLSKLQKLLEEEHGFTMHLARPPHYVDKIPDGTNSYDAYRYLGYQYLAASFDGGGWLPSCGDLAADVEKMVAPLRHALSENPDALSGQIIFQKDGFSMSRHTPVAEALPLQLKILSDYGYEVVSVSELMKLSPFVDAIDEDAAALSLSGYTVAYKNNMLLPERELTFGELVMMSADPQEMLTAYRVYVDAGLVAEKEDIAVGKKYRLSLKHPYFFAFALAAKRGLIDAKNTNGLSVSSPVSGELFAAYLKKLSPESSFGNLPEKLLRRDAFPYLKNALL